MSTHTKNSINRVGRVSSVCHFQWVQKWAVPFGCASLHPCPPPVRSPVSWLICRAQWWASAWGCWSCAATRSLCINSAPGGCSSSPSSPSSSSPSSGTFSLTSCSGYRSRPLPDDTPTLVESHAPKNPTSVYSARPAADVKKGCTNRKRCEMKRNAYSHSILKNITGVVFLMNTRRQLKGPASLFEQTVSTSYNTNTHSYTHAYISDLCEFQPEAHSWCLSVLFWFNSLI